MAGQSKGRFETDTSRRQDNGPKLCPKIFTYRHPRVSKKQFHDVQIKYFVY